MYFSGVFSLDHTNAGIVVILPTANMRQTGPPCSVPETFGETAVQTACLHPTRTSALEIPLATSEMPLFTGVIYIYCICNTIYPP